MNYEVLYYLMNEKMTLVEIKKEKEYTWFMQRNGDALNKLEFVSMKEEEVNENTINVRVFENSELRFDKMFGKFVLGDELFILKNFSQGPIPEELKSNISNFWS